MGVAAAVEVLALLIGVPGTLVVQVAGTTMVVLVLLMAPSTMVRTVEMWSLKVPKSTSMVDPVPVEV